jgi:hypothetical protein
MMSWQRLLSIAFLLGLCHGFASEEKETHPLVKQLTETLGVSQEQALGGLGSLMTYGKALLKEDQFSQLKEGVPGMDDLLNAAPEVKEEGGGLGGLLGGDAKTLLATKALEKRFEALGLKPEWVAKYLPVVVTYLKEKGGEALSGPFSSLFN